MKKHVLYTACVVLLLGACKKEVDTDAPAQQAKSGTVTSTNYYEDLYDLHIQTGVFGLLDLVKDQQFRNLVVAECNKQFDGDDNVLFSSLDQIYTANGQNLASAMASSLNIYGKGNLVQYVDGVIHGFDYYDSQIYLQIYVPFIENINMGKVPVLAPIMRMPRCWMRTMLIPPMAHYEPRRTKLMLRLIPCL